MKLPKLDRQQKIVDEFRISPAVRLGDLADRYSVTKETIRRDIDELSEQGILARTYGGAVASPMNYEPGLRERTAVNPEGRRRMAQLAVGLIADCAIVMIDTGATVASFCEQLAISVPKSGGTKLTAITNSLRNAAMLGSNPSIRVILCPGDYDDRENAVFGPQAVEFVGRYGVDAVIMSAGGISGESVTDANSEAAAIKRAMLKRANRSILMIDRRKLDFQQFETVCDVSDIDDLVTDEQPGRDIALLLTKTKVHVAGGKAGKTAV